MSSERAPSAAPIAAAEATESCAAVAPPIVAPSDDETPACAGELIVGGKKGGHGELPSGEELSSAATKKIPLSPIRDSGETSASDTAPPAAAQEASTAAAERETRMNKLLQFGAVADGASEAPQNDPSEVEKKLEELRDAIIRRASSLSSPQTPTNINAENPSPQTLTEAEVDHQRIRSLTEQVVLLKTELKQLRTAMEAETPPTSAPVEGDMATVPAMQSTNSFEELAPRRDLEHDAGEDWEAIKARRLNLALRSQELTGEFESNDNVAAGEDDLRSSGWALSRSEQAAAATIKHLQASLEQALSAKLQAEQRCQLILEEAGLRKSRDELILLQVFESYETRFKFEKEARQAAEAKASCQGAEIAAFARERSENLRRTPGVESPLSRARTVAASSPPLNADGASASAVSRDRTTLTPQSAPEMGASTPSRNALSSYPTAVLSPELQDIAKNLQELDDEIALSRKLRRSLRPPPQAPP